MSVTHTLSERTIGSRPSRQPHSTARRERCGSPSGRVQGWPELQAVQYRIGSQPLQLPGSPQLGPHLLQPPQAQPAVRGALAPSAAPAPGRAGDSARWCPRHSLLRPRDAAACSPAAGGASGWQEVQARELHECAAAAQGKAQGRAQPANAACSCAARVPAGIGQTGAAVGIAAQAGSTGAGPSSTSTSITERQP